MVEQNVFTSQDIAVWESIENKIKSRRYARLETHFDNSVKIYCALF